MSALIQDFIVFAFEGIFVIVNLLSISRDFRAKSHLLLGWPAQWFTFLAESNVYTDTTKQAIDVIKLNLILLLFFTASTPRFGFENRRARASDKTSDFQKNKISFKIEKMNGHSILWPDAIIEIIMNRYEWIKRFEKCAACPECRLPRLPRLASLFIRSEALLWDTSGIWKTGCVWWSRCFLSYLLRSLASFLVNRPEIATAPIMSWRCFFSISERLLKSIWRIYVNLKEKVCDGTNIK